MPHDQRGTRAAQASLQKRPSCRTYPCFIAAGDGLSPVGEGVSGCAYDPPQSLGRPVPSTKGRGQFWHGLQREPVMKGGGMRPAISVWLLFFPLLTHGAAPAPEGRWEGPLQIPGRELQLVVDLAQDGGGTWTGSIIIPGLGIKGAPLANIVVTDTELAFDLGHSLSSPTYGPAGFKAQRSAGDRMSGTMTQGGLVAPFSLQRTAAAHVELSPHSTPVGHDLEDRWTGDYDLGGYPRHVTITLENHAAAAATARFVVVGKQTTDLPVDLVIEEGDLLRVESQAARIAFEGRFVKERDEIRGSVELGQLEVPLVLHRAPEKTS